MANGRLMEPFTDSVWQRKRNLIEIGPTGFLNNNEESECERDQIN